MRFIVIGLGKFGLAATLELQRLNNEVVAVDADEKLVQKLTEQLNYAVVADATDKAALQELGVSDADGVLLAIGADLEASLLCALNLLNLNVKNIWVKAKNEAHYKILEKLGIKKIIQPEREMGIKVAAAMNYPMITQYMPMGDDYFIIKVTIDEDNYSLSRLKEKYPNNQFLALKRDTEIITAFSDNFMLQKNDRLLIMGLLDDLKELAFAFM